MLNGDHINQILITLTDLFYLPYNGRDFGNSVKWSHLPNDNINRDYIEQLLLYARSGGPHINEH
jgi:hypothetical protein